MSANERADRDGGVNDGPWTLNLVSSDTSKAAAEQYNRPLETATFIVSLPHFGQVKRYEIISISLTVLVRLAAVVRAALQAGAPSQPPLRVRRVPTVECKPLF